MSILRGAELMSAQKFSDDELKQAMAEGLTVEKIAERFDTVERVVYRRRAALARKGFAPEHNMTRQVPDGFIVKGVSTYYNRDGVPSGQWVKSAVDAERQREIWQAAFDAMAEELPRVTRQKPADADAYLADLMAVYPIGDAHIGMRAWSAETGGGDWDLKIAERVQCGAMAALVYMAPPAEKAVIVNLGDWFHSDNMEGTTSRSGHILDMDGRYAKMIHVGIKVMRQCIESALTKHAKVRVINVIGNHDDTGALWLSTALSNIYENEPRVEVDTSPAPFMYVEHGKVLIGLHHGHTCKPDRLPGVMATDQAQAWGRTEYRVWMLGHVHHQSVKEYAGVTVESFNTLTAKDAWAAWGGYRAQQNMKCIVMHRKYGEVGRHCVNPAMLEVSQD
jgi:predicted phosphodiesterase